MSARPSNGAAPAGGNGACGGNGRRWRGAVIGCGRMGAAHAERIAAHPAGELAAVWDVDPERASALAKRHGAVPAPHLDALLEPGAVDWALVATPPANHRAVAVRLLAAGVHVLVEKPLARSVGEARSIFAAAAGAPLVARTATKYPHVPDVRRARDLIRDGAVGELRRVEVTFAAPLDPRSDWRCRSDVAGGGVLIDNGPHAFDLLEYLAGRVVALEAKEGARSWASAVDEEVRLDVHGADGWEGAITLSWTRPADGPDYARVTGTRGEIRLGWKGSLVADASGERAFGPGYEKIAALDAQLTELYAALAGYAPSPDRGLRDLQLVEAGYAALERGGPIAVPEDEAQRRA